MFRRIHRIQSNRSNLLAKLPLWLHIQTGAFCYTLRLMKAYFSLAHNKFYVTQSIHPLSIEQHKFACYSLFCVSASPSQFFSHLHFSVAAPTLQALFSCLHLSNFSFLALSAWISSSLYLLSPHSSRIHSASPYLPHPSPSLSLFHRFSLYLLLWSYSLYFLIALPLLPSRDSYFLVCALQVKCSK